MPKQDIRTKASVRSGQLPTSGHMTVTYRNARGVSTTATVLGPGTTSGLKLAVGLNRTVVDNVPAATGVKTPNAYVAR